MDDDDDDEEDDGGDDGGDVEGEEEEGPAGGRGKGAGAQQKKKRKVPDGPLALVGTTPRAKSIEELRERLRVSHTRVVGRWLGVWVPCLRGGVWGWCCGDTLAGAVRLKAGSHLTTHTRTHTHTHTHTQTHS
jgi:hypothetical protein